ncbi:hypothetical protein ACWGNE_02245 [Streptomyces xiamenensis]
MTTLDHLLSRARRGVLLPEEGEVLAAEVRRLRADRPVAVTPAMVRAAGEALEDECLTRRGHDLGTIHRDDIARAALEAALAAVAPPAPLDGPVAASDPDAGPERHPGGSTARQTGAGGVALAATTLHPVLDTASTATSGPQSGVHGPDGPPEGQGSHGAADGRTAARDGAR